MCQKESPLELPRALTAWQRATPGASPGDRGAGEEPLARTLPPPPPPPPSRTPLTHPPYPRPSRAHLPPLPPQGFSCFYIIVGVTYVFSVIAKAATIGMNVIELQNMRIVQFFQRMAGIETEQVAVDLDGDGDVDYIPPPPASIYYLKGIGFWVVVLFVLQAALAPLARTPTPTPTREPWPLTL